MIAVINFESSLYSVASTVELTMLGMDAWMAVPCRTTPWNPKSAANIKAISGATSKRNATLNCIARILPDNSTFESSTPNKININGIVPPAARSTARYTGAGMVMLHALIRIAKTTPYRVGILNNPNAASLMFMCPSEAIKTPKV